MASYFTRSKVPRPSECDDVEPSDVAPVVASSSPSTTTVRLSVAAVGESESMSTELAEPVSAHPAGRPTSLGGPGVEGPAGSTLVGVSALRYPSGLAGPPDSSMHSGGHMSLSLATEVAASQQRDQSPPSYSSSLRQLPAAATVSARLPPESVFQRGALDHAYVSRSFKVAAFFG